MATKPTTTRSITDASIAAFTCPAEKGQEFLRDRKTTGLCVRATPSGTKTFVFESKLKGKTIRLTLGTVGLMTLEQARTQALANATLLDQGKDPREIERERQEAERVQKETEAAQEITGLEVWEKYAQAKASTWAPATKADAVQLTTPGRPKKNGEGMTQQGVLYPLLSRPLKCITTELVEAWGREQNAQRATTTAKAWRNLRAMLNWCNEREEFEFSMPQGKSNPLNAGGRLRDVFKKTGVKNDAIEREQLKSWFDVALKQNPITSAYLQVLLLTGSRAGEIRNLRWENLDFRWKTITISAGLYDQRVIPMTPYIEYLLSRLPTRNDWIFTSTRLNAADARMKSPNKAMKRVCVHAGIPHVSLHGLRRSFATLTEWLEIPVGVVAQIQGHAPSALAEKHYKRRPVDMLRKYAERIETWILEQAGVKFTPAPTLRLVA